MITNEGSGNRPEPLLYNIMSSMVAPLCVVSCLGLILDQYPPVSAFKPFEIRCFQVSERGCVAL